MKYMKVGSDVLVHIPEEDRAVHTAVAEYHGRMMTIADRKTIGNTNNVYYVLDGAKSECGLPLSFVKEWLIPL